MKKSAMFILVFVSIGIAGVFAAGTVEYKGQNYLGGWLSGRFAAAYAENIDLSKYDFSPVIANSNLYFIARILSTEPDSVLKRGFIQDNDRFILDEKFPDTFAVYKGAKKNLTGLPLKNSDKGIFLGIGYATKGKGIFLTEVIVSQEEQRIFEKSVKEVGRIK